MIQKMLMNSLGQLRIQNFNPSISYDIGNIEFAIENKLLPTRYQVFLIIKTQNNLYDIIELVHVKQKDTQYVNSIFQLSLDQPLRIENEQVTLKLLIINSITTTYNYSSDFILNIRTDHYKIARQVYVSQLVGQKVEDYYSKITMLAEHILKQDDQKGDNN